MHPLQTQYISEIEKLATASGSVLWVMDSAFEKELFVSSTYAHLWGLVQTDLYHDVRHCYSYLNDNIDNKIFEGFKKRVINPVHTEIYSLNLANNAKQWIQDRSFHLNDSKGQCLIIAGAALMINEDDFSDENQQIISDKLDSICLEFYRLLKLPLLQSNDPAFDINSYPLNEKQKLVFKLILLGLTAKEIARKAHMSFRTVEAHTDKIKEIFNVMTKSELIILAIENNWVTVNI